MSLKKIVSSLFLILAYSASVNAADWKLNTGQSVINFVSIKKEKIAEVHNFAEFSGHITGEIATVIIQTNSVDTGVIIRDQRMKDFLFESKLHPTIEVTVNTGKLLTRLPTGSLLRETLPASLSLHGITQEINVDTIITRVSEATLLVSSAEPIIINANTFNLVPGIEKLSSLVNSIPISLSVPVNFSLLFKQSKPLEKTN